MKKRLPFGVCKALENGIAAMLKEFKNLLEKAESGRDDFAIYLPGNCRDIEEALKYMQQHEEDHASFIQKHAEVFDKLQQRYQALQESGSLKTE